MLHPIVNPLRELRCSLSKLKLNSLAVGADARNRTPLWAFGAKTARCAPSTTKYVFGPAKWLRFNIVPPPGLALIHRDYQQQEVRIAAVESGDADLLAACESGDVYLGIAEQIGLLRDSMNDEERAAVRDLAKIIVLSDSIWCRCLTRLAALTGMTRSEAHEILARLRARFHRFYDFVLLGRRSRRAQSGNLDLLRLAAEVSVGQQPTHHPKFPHAVRRGDDPAHRVPAGRAARD